MRRIQKICLRSLSILFFLIASLAFFLINTNGLHIMINSVVRCIPGLDISHISGDLNNLTLKSFRYHIPGMSLSAEELHISLDLSCFKHSSLCVNALTARDVNVIFNTKEITLSIPAKQIGTPSTHVSTLYPIILRMLALDNLTIVVDDTTISLEELQTGVKWKDSVLTLISTKINSLLIQFPKKPKASWSQAIEVAVKEKTKTHDQENKVARLALQYGEPPLLQELKSLFNKPLLLNFPEFYMPIDIIFQQINAENLRLINDTDTSITHLFLQGKIKDQYIQVDRFEAEAEGGTISAQGAATLIGDYVVNMLAKITLNILPLRGETITIILSGKLNKILNIAINLSGSVVATINAETRLSESGLPLVMTLKSKELKWPISGASQYQFKDFLLQFNGKITEYKLSARANISSHNLPKVALILDGTGSIEQFKLQNLRLATLEGNINLTALIDWRNAVSWEACLTLNSVNTATFWPKWPESLGGKMTIFGSVYGEFWQIRVPKLRLDGNLKRSKFTVLGTLSGDNSGRWNIPDISVMLGENRLNIRGQLNNKAWIADASVDASCLSEILPELGGILKGNLTLRGNLQAPKLLVNLTASDLKWRTLRTSRLKIYGDIHSATQIQGRLAIRIKKLQQGTSTIRLLTLYAKGSEKKHHIQLEIEDQSVSGQIALHGILDRQKQRWRGYLNNTRFATPFGEWRLIRAIPLNYLNTNKQISIGPHCWKNLNSQLCVLKTIKSDQISAIKVVLKRFDLAIFKPFINSETEVTGALIGKANFIWKYGETLPSGSISLVGDGVTILHQAQGRLLPISFNTFQINFALNNSYAQADWIISLNNNSQLDGHIQIGDPKRDRNIIGRINITNLPLEMIPSSLIQGLKASGILNGSFQLTGSIKNLRFMSRLILEKVNLKGRPILIDTTDGPLSMSFNNMTSVLEGLISTRGETLNLKKIDWKTRITLKSDQLRIMISPILRIECSPDLILEATPKMFALNGSVVIPWARIALQEIPESTVIISSDEVMLNSQLKPIQPKPTSIPINSNLMIHIRDDVRLEAFGFKSGLKGDLELLYDKRGLGLNGNLNITSGRFHAYGQDLIVRKGQLMFSGPPDQSILNFEAIRNPDSTKDGVTAGVRVTGSIDTPKIEVFSDTAKSQQEVLSYLLRGQGLLSSDANENVMRSMLISIGLAHINQVIGKIGKAFGVNDLTLDTQGDGDGSQVLVSAHVFPGFQVKYGIGMFDSLTTLTLRYQLMPKLYLEAVSGIDHALNLLYQFEF